MSGKRIESAKTALQLLLRSLPSGWPVNICSFGSGLSLLWEKGQLLDRDTFKFASSEVQAFEANLGGTELRGALKRILLDEPETLPRIVLVMTDGEVSNPEELIEEVRACCTTRRSRVFSLGIGSSASQLLVQGLASAGGGVHATVSEDERLETIVMKLARRIFRNCPSISDARIDWGGVEAMADDWVVDDEKVQVRSFLKHAPPSVAMRLKLGGMDREISAPLHFTKGSILHRALATILSNRADDPQEGLRWALDFQVASKYTSLLAVTSEYAVLPARGPLKVQFMDGTTKTIQPPSNASTGEDFLNEVGAKLGLCNVEEYGLIGPDGKWLNLRAPVPATGQFQLKKRFFCDDLNVDRSDPIQLHLAYVQQKESVASRALPVNDAEAAKLEAIRFDLKIIEG